MLKTVLATLITLAIAIGGGAGSVWYVLQADRGFGAMRIGPWTAFPAIGTPDADPYTKARIARDGVLPLGQAEGLSFTAERDSAGAELRRECIYGIEGRFAPARFWTLYAADPSQAALDTGTARPAALQSSSGLLREADNSVRIVVGGRPAPGNWLLVNGSGAMSLVLTFYDTPIAGSTGLSDIVLPQILKVGCDA
jgi:hypothetical protein